MAQLLKSFETNKIERLRININLLEAPMPGSKPNANHMLEKHQKQSQLAKCSRCLSYLQCLIVICVLLFLGYSILTFDFDNQYHVHFDAVCEIPKTMATYKKANCVAVRPVFGSYFFSQYMLADKLLYLNSTNYIHQDIQFCVAPNNNITKLKILNNKENSIQFLHDAALKQSVIVDEKRDMCYIMQMEPSDILSPPDFVAEIKTIILHSSEKRFTHVHRKLHTIAPPLDPVETRKLSYVIQVACKRKMIYHMESTSMPSEILKHVLNDEVILYSDINQFTLYFGSNVIHFHMFELVTKDTI